MAVLNTILGKGPSSLLFQKIREEAGLSYSVCSFIEYFEDTGVWGIFAGTEPDKTVKFYRILQDILQDLRNNPLPETLIEETVTGLCGRLLLENDSISAMLTRLAETELFAKRYIPTAEAIEKLKKVTAEDLIQLSQELFNPDKIVGLALGPVKKAGLPDWLEPVEGKVEW
jgi:predicted Zn-dependent peptidase